MKKAIIVSCFGSYFYEERLKYVYQSLIKHNYETKILMSDFDHTRKIKIKKNAYPNFVNYIHTRAYRKNVSIGRVMSHYYFAKGLKSEIEEISPDLIYYLMPPNIVGKIISDYKSKHDDCFLIADVMDLWPESFPLGIFHNKLNFIEKIWKKLRTKSLEKADYIIFECDLYKTKLGIKDNCDVIYLPMREFDKRNDKCNGWDCGSSLKIAYIGQVSHIVDMNLIEKLLLELSKRWKIELHIIGTGTNYRRFINRMQAVVTKIYEYGAVYDENEIERLIGGCHFGLNIMKKNVQVGLTMKSMVYIGLGIPIINNIKGDTWRLVDRYNVGINVTDKNVQYDDIPRYKEMHENMKMLQSKVFSKSAIQNKFDDLMSNILLDVKEGI